MKTTAVVLTLSIAFVGALVVFARPAQEAADSNNAIYKQLVAGGVNRDVAAAMTASTEIIAQDDQQLHYRQTMPGGGKRDVNVTLTPMPTPKGPAVPIALDDGTVFLVQDVNVAPRSDGYAVRFNYFIPAKSLTSEMAEAFGLSRPRRWTLGDLLGIQTVLAAGQSSGVSVGFSDTSSGLNTQSLAKEVGKVADSATYEFLKTTKDVVEIVQKNQGAPTSQSVDVTKNVGKVLDHAGKMYKIAKEHWTMEDKLRALRDCHNNPTNRLAREAMTNDPKAHEAVNKDLDARKLDLQMNSTIRVAATTMNGGASVLLGKVSGPLASKAVSLLDKIEDQIMQHLAEEYTMKGAGKGVVPCDCDPVDTPLPPTDEVASYPPASMSCEPKPEALVCQAAPPSPSAPSHTPGPPPRLKSADVCGVLTHAQFTYTKSEHDAGCSPMGCGSREETIFYTGSAVLKPVQGGYKGDGPGAYRLTGWREARANVPGCNTESAIWWLDGKVSLEVNAQFSINNSVTGGIDTSAMPANTTVVEIITHGEGLHDEQHTYTCDGHKVAAIDTQGVGFDCHFYGVDLYRPGFYKTYKDRETKSGVCTLVLSR
jgi:hypothetical protein